MLDSVKNFAKGTVSTGYDLSATTVELSSGDGAKFPQPSTDGAFNIVWWNASDYSDPSDDPDVEIVRCMTRSSDTLTVNRAQEDTTASDKNTGGKTYKMILSLTRKMITDIGSEQVGEVPTGDVNDVNAVFTLDNTPIASSEKVFLNGARQKGGGTDYTISGDQITFTYAPLTNDSILVDYRY